ncbi:MAG: hypothetical protein GEV09_00265 [Pseudonocardiaceae bacterium]|nr:hypothetical protein [Pseudonocardiaceae bacterium]
MDRPRSTDGKPPGPDPVGFRERWRVAWHGRRDGKQDLPTDPDARRPYLENLRADAEAGQRAVGAWLHGRITPIDREAVALLTLLDQHRRDPASPPNPTPARPVTGAEPRVPGWILESRRIAAEQQAYRRRIKERDAAERQLSELGSTRGHLIEIARAAADAHACRYEQLAGLYGAAFVRHHPARDFTDVRATPPAVATVAWLHGALPLLALEIDTELTESYRWTLMEFESYTATAAAPAPDGLTAQRRAHGPGIEE